MLTIFVELILLAVCLLLTGRKAKHVFFFNRKSIFLGILFGLLYVSVIFLVKQTNIGFLVLQQFVTGIGLPLVLLYTIYPLAIALSEEFVFRYFLVRKIGVFLAVLTFTIFHWRPNFPTPLFILIFIFGFSQVWLFKKTKTIWSVVIAHLFVTYAVLLI